GDKAEFHQEITFESNEYLVEVEGFWDPANGVRAPTFRTNLGREYTYQAPQHLGLYHFPSWRITAPKGWHFNVLHAAFDKAHWQKLMFNVAPIPENYDKK